ncbi:MAG: transposase [Candidatus Thiodiazotropha sp.]
MRNSNMIGKNRYYKRSRITEKKFRLIIRYFALDISASDTARLTGISVRSINPIYIKLRTRLSEECERLAQYKGISETIGTCCRKNMAHNNTDNNGDCKTMLFGIIKQNGWVYTEIIPGDSKQILQSVMRDKLKLDSRIHPDGRREYQGLIDMSRAKYYHIQNRDSHSVSINSKINGSETFWAYAKLRLSKMKGIRHGMFYFHLKETEFRFNHRREDVYPLVLKLLRENPI